MTTRTSGSLISLGAWRTLRSMAHITRTIARYKRDLALMTGKLVPLVSDPDDVVILDEFLASDDPEAMIADRKLRIKTLQVMLELLRDTA